MSTPADTEVTVYGHLYESSRWLFTGPECRGLYNYPGLRTEASDYTQSNLSGRGYPARKVVAPKWYFDDLKSLIARYHGEGTILK